MEKHASWIVALIVGVAIGVVGDRMITGGGAAGTSGPTAAAGPTGEGRHTPADLPPNYIKEDKLPAGTLAGLNDQQKYDVLKVINENRCTCGCANDTIAECRTKDPNCSTAPQLITTAINLARQGKGAEEIKQQLGGGAQAKAAPQRPVEDPKAVYKVPVDDSPTMGPSDALVTIVESSDFQ